MNHIEHETGASFAKTTHTIAWTIPEKEVPAMELKLLMKIEQLEDDAEKRLRKSWPDRSIEKFRNPDLKSGYVRAKP